MGSKGLREFLSFLATLLALVASAQSPEEVEEAMLNVKLNEAYIYGESFDSNMEKASLKALTDLLAYVNEQRQDRGLGILSAADLENNVRKLSYSRGDRCNVLLYMPLENAFSIGGGVSISEATRPTESVSKSDPVSVNPPTSSSLSLDEEVIDILCGQDNWTEVKGLLSDFKREGRIKETGIATSPNEVPEDACAILVDGMYGILSMLSPRNSPQRINYRTDNLDSESNYSNCKVIVWYR